MARIPGGALSNLTIMPTTAKPNLGIGAFMYEGMWTLLFLFSHNVAKLWYGGWGGTKSGNVVLVVNKKKSIRIK
jgi:hypothetical protein